MLSNACGSASRATFRIILGGLFLLFMICVPSAYGWHPWVRSGPEGGDIVVMIEDPLRPEHLWASPWFEGLFESFDGGLNWSEIKSAPAVIPSIVFDPFDNRRMFACAWGFAISEDGGRTWRYPIAPGVMRDGALYNIDASTRVNGLLYIASYVGIYRSRDWGNTWTLHGSDIVSSGRMETVTASRAQDSVVFVSGGGHTWRSDDYGETWKKLFDGTARITFSSHDPMRGIAHLFRDRLLLTVDGGATWAEPSPNSNINAFAFDPTAPGRLIGSQYEHVVQSDDWGRTWNRTGVRLPRSPVSSILITKEPRRVFVLMGGYGVSELLGTQIVWRNRGLHGLPVQCLLVNGPLVFAGTHRGGIHVSADTSVWQSLPDASPQYHGWWSGGEDVFDLMKNGSAILMSSNRGLYRSGDFGARWDRLHDTSFYDMTEGSSTSELFGAGWQTIMKSTDNGQTWQKLPGPFATYTLSQIVFDRSARLLFASSYTQGAPLFRSHDGGTTWTELRPGFSQTNGLIVSPHGGLYAANRGYGVFKTTDGGDSWTRVTDQSARWMNWVRVVAFDAADPNMMILGTDGYGAFASLDGGRSFVEIDALRDRSVAAIVRHGDRWLFGTDEGVYSRIDPLVGVRRRPVRKGSGASVPSSEKRF